jgi:hypothetical protein
VEKEIDIAQGREERYSADKNEVFHIWLLVLDVIFCYWLLDCCELDNLNKLQPVSFALWDKWWIYLCCYRSVITASTLFLCYSPSHMQTCVTILKLFLHHCCTTCFDRYGHHQMLRNCYWNCCTVASKFKSMRPCVVVRFMVMGDSSCRVVCTWWWSYRSKHVVQEWCKK